MLVNYDFPLLKTDSHRLPQAAYESSKNPQVAVHNIWDVRSAGVHAFSKPAHTALRHPGVELGWGRGGGARALPVAKSLFHILCAAHALPWKKRTLLRSVSGFLFPHCIPAHVGALLFAVVL